MSKSTMPVVIAGAGPVGLVLAIDLARQGVRSIVVDRKEGVQWTSRASCISRRSQEILRRIGITPEFFAKSLPWHRGRTFHGSEEVFELTMPYDRARDAYAPMVNLQQFYTEQFLIETAATLEDYIDLRWATEFAGHAQDSDGVDVTLRDTATGVETVVRGGFLAGCDGARSAVRSALGLKLQGRTYEGRYLIADIRMGGDIAQPVERWVWFNPQSNAGSTTILHVQPDRVWRIDVQVHGDTPDEVLLDEANVRSVVQRHLDMMGLDAPWDLVWHSIYRANALSLDAYRHGRVFLAGDAAHLVPIFGVRGMNSGIDDAHNLAWKLAAALNGGGNDTVLDSFTDERRTACLENLGNAVRSTWFMSPPSEGFRIMRDGALLLAERADWARALINPRQSTAHVYSTSRVISDQAREGLQPGAVVPDLPVREGGHLHARLATAGRFTLLIDARRPENPAIQNLPAKFEDCDVVLLALVGDSGLVLEDADMAVLFAHPEAPIMVVRPDEHIVGWATGAEEALDLLALARGHGSHRTAPDFRAVVHADLAAPPSQLERMFEQLAHAVDNGDLTLAEPNTAALALEEAYSTLSA